MTFVFFSGIELALAYGWRMPVAAEKEGGNGAECVVVSPFSSASDGERGGRFRCILSFSFPTWSSSFLLLLLCSLVLVSDAPWEAAAAAEDVAPPPPPPPFSRVTALLARLGGGSDAGEVDSSGGEKIESEEATTSPSLAHRSGSLRSMSNNREEKGRSVVGDIERRPRGPPVLSTALAEEMEGDGDTTCFGKSIMGTIGSIPPLPLLSMPVAAEVNGVSRWNARLLLHAGEGGGKEA